MMTESCSQKNRVPEVDFKIEPFFIPSARITKHQLYPHGSGGIGDIWKCSMSTQAGVRQVSKFANG
jgi:hypothetical protein